MDREIYENYVELRGKNVLLNMNSDSNYMGVVFVCMCFFGLIVTTGKLEEVCGSLFV